jgi:hypothetical protein
MLVFSGRSCIIGPAVASSSSLALRPATKPKESPHDAHGSADPFRRSADFSAPCVPCHSRRPVKTLFLFELVSQHLTLPARDQLFVSGEKSGGFSCLAQKVVS